MLDGCNALFDNSHILVAFTAVSFAINCLRTLIFSRNLIHHGTRIYFARSFVICSTLICEAPNTFEGPEI